MSWKKIELDTLKFIDAELLHLLKSLCSLSFQRLFKKSCRGMHYWRAALLDHLFLIFPHSKQLGHIHSFPRFLSISKFFVFSNTCCIYVRKHARSPYRLTLPSGWVEWSSEPPLCPFSPPLLTCDQPTNEFYQSPLLAFEPSLPSLHRVDLHVHQKQHY